MPLELETPHGVARVRLERPAVATRTGHGAGLVLGHGAGGGIDSPDLVAAAEAAFALGVIVARVEQPYRVAGRRAPAPAAQLDVAWLSVVEALQAGPLAGLPIIAGGRSSGARVACRTATAAGAAAVLCLAFPLHPPGRPERSRLDELASVAVPVLVVQGERDPFGLPPAARGREVVVVPGTHSLRAAGAIRAAVSAWIEALLDERRMQVLL